MFTLKEALEAIKNKTEFSCNPRDFGFVIDYHVALKDTFVGVDEAQTRILQNLRGTCFNHDGKIIRLCYHKFHNLNENEEYSAKNFDFRATNQIQEKLDGSMIAPIPMNGSWRLGTRAGVTEVSMKAEAYLQNLFESNDPMYHGYISLINNLLKMEFTPIFEFCSRAQRIVLDYPETKLVLTGVRMNEDGSYIFDSTSFANVYGIPHAEIVSTEHSTISELAEKLIRPMQGQEGVVVKFANGTFVKIKAEDYVLKHRALDGLRFEKDVLAIVLKNELDDVLPLVTPDVKERLVKYADSVNHFIRMHQGVMISTYEDFEKQSNDRREFALLAKDSAYKNGLFKIFEGKPYDLRNFAATKTGSSSAVEEIRWLIGPSYDSF